MKGHSTSGQPGSAYFMQTGPSPAPSCSTTSRKAVSFQFEMSGPRRYTTFFRSIVSAVVKLAVAENGLVMLLAASVTCTRQKYCVVMPSSDGSVNDVWPLAPSGTDALATIALKLLLLDTSKRYTRLPAGPDFAALLTVSVGRSLTEVAAFAGSATTGA